MGGSEEKIEGGRERQSGRKGGGQTIGGRERGRVMETQQLWIESKTGEQQMKENNYPVPTAACFSL